MYDGARAVAILRHSKATQRAAQQRIIVTRWGILRRPSETTDFIACFSTQVIFDSSSGPDRRAVLIADNVDGLNACGLVDPTECLPRKVDIINVSIWT